MPVEWPKLAPHWLFAQLLMKPIRVSTCLCHFHLICVCKPSAPIARRPHGRRRVIGPSAARYERMAEALPARPAPSDTFPCEKQHGAARWPYRPHTHTPHVRHISCSVAPSAPVGFTAQLRETLTELIHPWKVRSFSDTQPKCNRRF